MNNIQTNIPMQRTGGLLVRALKAALHTQFGKGIAFFAGLKGFDRMVAMHLKFLREYQREKLANGEQVMKGDDGISRVYSAPKLAALAFNSRVDKGAALQASLMSGSALGSCVSPLPPIYVALSTASLSAAKGDTTLASETVVAGIARALGTAQNYVVPASLDAAASYDVYKQFTLTGAGTTVVSTALFDAPSTGNMFAEVNFGSSAVMATNDILQVTWTVNI
jgi:hypothetical protein